jgi:hypothetical protein
MQVLVRVTGEFDPQELWPYVTASPTAGSSRLLTLDVHDSRELVSVLVAFADRGITILQAKSRPDPPDETSSGGGDAPL